MGSINLSFSLRNKFLDPAEQEEIVHLTIRKLEQLDAACKAGPSVVECC